MNSPHFQDFCDGLQDHKDETDLWAATTSYFEDLGIDGLLYADVKPFAPAIKASLGSDWTEHYSDQDYISVDPFFQYCCNSYAAMNVGPDCVPDHDYMSPKEKQFIADASDTGLTAGFTSPIKIKSKNGLTGWSFLSSYGRAHVDHLRESQENEMRLIGSLVHQHLIEMRQSPKTCSPLTAREREALQWTAHGFRTSMIADKMKLRTVTVEFHLRNAREKLDARTRDQAVTIALVSGQIAL